MLDVDKSIFLKRLFTISYGIDKFAEISVVSYKLKTFSYIFYSF